MAVAVAVAEVVAVAVAVAVSAVAAASGGVAVSAVPALAAGAVAVTIFWKAWICGFSGFPVFWEILHFWSLVLCRRVVTKEEFRVRSRIFQHM